MKSERRVIIEWHSPVRTATRRSPLEIAVFFETCSFQRDSASVLG
jgi:hypothetical protein